MSTAPVRALRLTMALEADTQRDMAWALRNMADRIERDQVSTGVWGSPTDGAIYELLKDPAMTHEHYHQRLREYLDARKEPPAIPTGDAQESSFGEWQEASR